MRIPVPVDATEARRARRFSVDMVQRALVATVDGDCEMAQRWAFWALLESGNAEWFTQRAARAPAWVRCARPVPAGPRIGGVAACGREYDPREWTDCPRCRGGRLHDEA